MAKKKKPGADESAAAVKKVLALRAEGLSYAAIEKEMGWPKAHAYRPFAIIKKAGMRDVDKAARAEKRAAKKPAAKPKASADAPGA